MIGNYKPAFREKISTDTWEQARERMCEALILIRKVERETPYRLQRDDVHNVWFFSSPMIVDHDIVDDDEE